MPISDPTRKTNYQQLKPEEIRKARMTDLRTIFECKQEQGIV